MYWRGAWLSSFLHLRCLVFALPSFAQVFFFWSIVRTRDGISYQWLYIIRCNCLNLELLLSASVLWTPTSLCSVCRGTGMIRAVAVGKTSFFLQNWWCVWFTTWSCDEGIRVFLYFTRPRTHFYCVEYLSLYANQLPSPLPSASNGGSVYSCPKSVCGERYSGCVVGDWQLLNFFHTATPPRKALKST